MCAACTVLKIRAQGSSASGTSSLAAVASGSGASWRSAFISRVIPCMASAQPKNTGTIRSCARSRLKPA